MDEAREGALSPTEIETHHRDEVQTMGCTCKKTRCLKLYCQCFGFKLYCGPNCRCLLCFNTDQHEKQRKLAMNTILARNPMAFDAKFKKDTPPVGAIVSAPAVPAAATGSVTESTDAATGTALATTTDATAEEQKQQPAEGTTAAPSDAATVPPVTANIDANGEATRILAHRLGCKCRRSACMKKVQCAPLQFLLPGEKVHSQPFRPLFFFS
jgi:Tesmin/TSO1-like CXC domain, cysteine-rich domain